MSNIYVTEPPTKGKVLLTTNRGEIEIELWSREAPKACRNFIQLFLEGYYIDTIFHRIITDFIIQGGDPTGTGTGGQSIFDEPFQDEFHSRLKYNRRGMVGMANNGKHDNGSQFFITLDSTPELQGKNTLFGRVMGDTIFNVVKIGNSEREEGSERPIYPARVIKTEVIVNPFDDIKPRITREELEKRRAAQMKANTTGVKSAIKNKKLLSFANQDEEDQEEEPIVFKSKQKKSAHDLLDDERLQSTNDKPKASTRKRKITPPPDEATSNVHETQKDTLQTAPPPVRSSSSSPPRDSKPQQVTAKDDVQAQIDALTSSLKRKRVEPTSQSSSSLPKMSDPKLSYIEQQKAAYTKKALIGGRKKAVTRHGFTEDDVLAKLAQFQNKLSTVTTTNTTDTADTNTTSIDKDLEQEEQQTCKLHGVPGCMSCFDRLGELNDTFDTQDPDSWLSHTLVFAADRLGKDATYKEQQRAEAELEVIDPREKAGQLALQRRQEARERDEKSGKNAYLRRGNATTNATTNKSSNQTTYKR